ncbi:unnamed protein product [Candida verbasci]|uniref:Pre-mRNA-splicing factor CWC22 n=1 Tax=Candida verbasci TaxID=1227364 RepID=A0A9W4XB16_9ASCO|nr:unnamed protein product [Candida verbasci]
MKNQLNNINKSALLASLISVINSKLPEIGELLCSRLVLQFKKNYMENNYKIVKSSIIFISNLVKFEVLSEITILQILQLFLDNDKLNNTSLSLSIEVLKIVGAYLFKNSKKALILIIDRLRVILQENTKVSRDNKKEIDRLLRLNRSNFKHVHIIEEGLDLVEDEDKEIHDIALNEDIESSDHLNYYCEDDKYSENEEKYNSMIEEILEESEDEKEDEKQVVKKEDKVVITDMSKSELLEVQKLVYLTIMSSMSSDEAVHKLLKLCQTKQISNDDILIDMIIKCCSTEKTYSKFYSQIAIKLINKNKKWHKLFIQFFKSYYEKIENFDSQQLRNLGKFFGNLFASDSIDLTLAWNEIKLNEENTNPPKRIMLKFIFQEMIEELGINEVKERLINDDYLTPHITGIFPVVNVDYNDEDLGDDLRFSINYFTAIGLGVLTDEMREVLKDVEENYERGRSRSRSSSRSSYSRSIGSNESFSRSRSRSRSKSRGQSFSRSPSPRGRQSSNENNVTLSRTPCRELAKGSKRSRTPSRESSNIKRQTLRNVLSELK